MMLLQYSTVQYKKNRYVGPVWILQSFLTLGEPQWTRFETPDGGYMWNLETERQYPVHIFGNT